MKRRELIARLQDAGGRLLRHGGGHDIYHNPQTGRSQPVPKHAEINERLARKILRDLTEDADG